MAKQKSKKLSYKKLAQILSEGADQEHKSEQLIFPTKGNREKRAAHRRQMKRYDAMARQNRAISRSSVKNKSNKLVAEELSGEAFLSDSVADARYRPEQHREPKSTKRKKSLLQKMKTGRVK